MQKAKKERAEPSGSKGETIKHYDDFADFLRDQRGLSGRTIKEYTYDLGYFFRWLQEAGKVLEKVEPKEMNEYVKHMRNGLGLGQATCKRRVAAVSTYYKWMVREKLADKDPVYFIELPKAPKRLPVYLSSEEVVKLYAELDQEADSRPIIGLRNRALTLLMINAGLRVSEAAQLVERQITLKDGYPVKVAVIGKGDKEREVNLNERTSKALRAWLEAKKLLRDDENFARKVSRKPKEVMRSEYVFPGQKGGHLEVRTIQRKIKRMRKMFGEKKVTPHKLRHTFATMLYGGGVDINTIRALLGHENIATTQIYTHVEDSQKAEAIRKLK
jgi:integrase/recombinase XerD